MGPQPRQLAVLAAFALVALFSASTGGSATGAGSVVVTHDRYPGHAEPDVAVNPRNRRNLVGACQFIVAPRTRLPGTFASFDGGRSWRDNGTLRLPHGFDQGADTTVAFDGRGNGFVAALLAEGGYASRVEHGGIFVWKTTNSGRSFSRPLAVYVGRGFQDHPWLATRGTTLFLAWTNARGLEFSVSRDDGRTFSRPRAIVRGGAPQDPVVTLGRGSELRVFFQEFLSGRTRLAVAESKDGGTTFAPPAEIAEVPSVPASGSGPKGGTIPPPLLGAAEDPDTGTAAVAIAAQDAQSGHPAVELWRTRLGTGRWAGPLRPAVGAAATVTQSQPRLVFAGSTLFVSFYTFSRTGDVGVWLARSSGGPFNARPLSTSPFRFGGWLGDYQAMTIVGSEGHALWTAARHGRLEILAGRFRPT